MRRLQINHAQSQQAKKSTTFWWERKTGLNPMLFLHSYLNQLSDLIWTHIATISHLLFGVVLVVRCIWSYSDVNLCLISSKLLLPLLSTRQTETFCLTSPYARNSESQKIHASSLIFQLM